MNSKRSDEELLGAFVAGDATAFNELWQGHAAAVRRFLRTLFGAQVATEDFLQEAFLSLVSNARGIRDPRLIRHYLLTAARRIAFIDRRRARQREQHELVAQGERSTYAVDHEARETLGKLERSLGRLSARRRAAFTLYCVEQRTIVESAELLGVSPATFRRELMAARRYVFRWMGNSEEIRKRPALGRSTAKALQHALELPRSKRRAA